MFCSIQNYFGIRFSNSSTLDSPRYLCMACFCQAWSFSYFCVVRTNQTCLHFGCACSSLPYAFIVGQISSLLSGSEIGLPVSLPWSVRYVGIVGLRHPVQMYAIAGLLLISFLLSLLSARAVKKQWSYGVIGIWFFMLYAPVFFYIEFFKDSSVYWSLLRVNQWVLLLLFGQACGALYVRGGIRESLRPFFSFIHARIIRLKGGSHEPFESIRP